MNLIAIALYDLALKQLRKLAFTVFYLVTIVMLLYSVANMESLSNITLIANSFSVGLGPLAVLA